MSTKSAKKVEEYLNLLYEDTGKEVAQHIFTSSPIRFEGVDIRDIVRIFEKYGITEVGF